MWIYNIGTMITILQQKQRTIAEMERWAIQNEVALVRDGWMSHDDFERLLSALRTIQDVLDRAVSSEEDADYGYPV